jgi:hypothetical protein
MIVVTLCALSAGVEAREAKMLGAGIFSCGRWSAGDSDRKWGDREWVLGFLSARNIDGPEFLEQTNAAAVDEWMDNYCRLHPLDHIYAAADALVLELVKRARGN